MPIPLTSTALVHTFGQRSHLAQQSLCALYDALSGDVPRYQHWLMNFNATKPGHLSISNLGKHYSIAKVDTPRLIFALQTYYALVVKLLTATYLAAPYSVGARCAAPLHTIQTFCDSVVDGSIFLTKGIRNFMEGDIYDWPAVDLQAAANAAAQFTFDDVPPDALKALYHDLFPRTLRHTLGEYYTPDWLAEHVLNRLDYRGQGRLLDPACGSGTFLAHALRRMPRPSLDHIAGIDVNPLACLAARATVLFHSGRPQSPVSIPIYCADSILSPPDIGLFDFIAGNPPWVNWESLPQTYREQSKQRWLDYGLFPHSGMESILGKGKKDLALLLTYASMDAFLRDGGKLGFILTQAVLKTGGAGAGFRKFMISDTPLAVVEVDDMSRIPAFAGASTRVAVMVLQKGAQTRYPVPYHLWRRRGQTIYEHDSLKVVQAKTKRITFAAEPVSAPDSAWLTGYLQALHAVRKLIGQSDYAAHAGVYTGGANAVYWLQVIGREGDCLRVRNITDGAKRSVPQVEALIEADFVFPLLRGRDVRRWQASPTAHILVVQNPQTRRGYDTDWLQTAYPRTYAYLRQFEAALRNRATFKRYFRPDAAFYSMFDVGAYTFAPVKVVWQGLGARSMQAAVLIAQETRPIMTNQAMHPMIGLYDENEAHYLAACINSAPFEYAVLSHTQDGGKSFAQPAILKTLRLPEYDPNNAIHQRLAALSRAAHGGYADDSAIALAAADLWGLSAQELADVQESLHDWR